MRRALAAFLLIATGAYGQGFPASVATDSYLLNQADLAQSTLSAGVNDTVTTFLVAAASSFRSNMVVVISSEQIACTSFSGTTFSGCQRGFAGTTRAAHLSGVNVSGYPVASNYNRLKGEVQAVEGY